MKLSIQQQKVYGYLLTHRQATAREIIQFTNYPSCLIRDLKAKGIEIDTVPIEGKNYDMYVLKQKELTLNLNEL